jgi:hypothetical protein
MITLNGQNIENEKVPKNIKQQPGYNASGIYAVFSSPEHGCRLYKAIQGKWMDASLKNDPSLSKYIMKK